MPDTAGHLNYSKVIRRASVHVYPDSFSYCLPFPKADHLFSGNEVIIAARALPNDPQSIFSSYLRSRDRLFALSSELFLTAVGQLPTRSWLLRRLHLHLPSSFARHSLRSGGATFFAAAGLPDNCIMALGRWSSDTFRLYIRKHPVVLQALLHGRTLTEHANGQLTLFSFSIAPPATPPHHLFYYDLHYGFESHAHSMPEFRWRRKAPFYPKPRFGSPS